MFCNVLKHKEKVQNIHPAIIKNNARYENHTCQVTDLPKREISRKPDLHKYKKIKNTKMVNGFTIYKKLCSLNRIPSATKKLMVNTENT